MAPLQPGLHCQPRPLRPLTLGSRTPFLGSTTLPHSTSRLAMRQQHCCRCSAAADSSANSLSILSAAKAILKGFKREATEPEPAEARKSAVCIDSTGAKTPQELSWDSWQQHIETVDQEAQRAAELDENMERAIKEEDYAEAQAVKKELDEILAKDALAKTLEAMEAALEEERFEDAARLRDEGCAGFLGWWVGHTENDPFGHVLRVSHAYGRLVGQAFLPRDLAQVKAWRDDGQLTEDQADSALDSIGSPVLELFVRRGPDGTLQRQGAVLGHGKPEGSPDSPPDGITVEQSNEDGQVISVSFTSSSAVDWHDVVSRLPAAQMSDMQMSSLDGEYVLQPDSDQELEMDLVGSSELTEASLGEEEIYVQFHRQPADLDLLNRNMFSLQVLDMPEKAGESSDAEDSGSDDASTQSEASDSGDAGSTGNGSTSVINIPMSEMLQGGVSEEAMNEAWQRVAEEIMKLQGGGKGGAGGPNALSKEQLADVIRGVANTLQPLMQASSGPEVQPLKGKITYSRLPTGLPKTDPFNGLYLGAFGPHGPELLHVQRGKHDDGEECVVATKLTGDANVPAGVVSFRAKVGRAQRLETREYPPELGVTARYRGEGRVAQPGYQDARWVEGELLQFSSNSYMTQGAQMGFVWAVPGEKRFLILLNRIDLNFDY